MATDDVVTIALYDNCLFPSPPVKEEFRLPPSDTLASLRRTIVDKYGYLEDSFEFGPWGVGRDSYTRAHELKTLAELFDVKKKILLNLNKTAAYKEGDFPSSKGRTSKTAGSIKLPPMNMVGGTSTTSSGAHEHTGFIGPTQPGGSGGGSVWTRSEAYDWNKKSESGFVGLSNQGATCYMNSLLQTLFMTPEFRAALYQWKFDPSKEADQKEAHGAAPAAAAAAGKKKKKDKPAQDPKEARSIPLQLQKLFARLQLSDLRAVKTKDLTKSFGWTDADAFTQHDVQELLRVLFDALERVMKGTAQANLINDLYEGQMKDYVQCQVCLHESSRLDKFLDVPLVIRPFGENRILHSVHEALSKFVQTEILEGDNAYMCDRCQKKVTAKKGLKFLKFPYLLALQLKRFDFDPETFQRVKLNDRVEFPLVLDLAPYLEDGAPAAPADGTAAAASSVPAAASPDVQNELPVTPAAVGSVDEDDSDEEEMIDPEILIKRRRHGEGRNKAKQRGILGERPLHQLASAAYAAIGSGRSSSSSKTGLRAPFNPNSKHLYDLFSVLIHRGTSMAGHYYAYIKSFETGKWHEFNDSSVSEIGIDKLEDTFGEDSRTASWYGRANAYMLMYRKRDPERNKNAVPTSEIPQYLQDAIAADLAEEKKRAEERQRERDSIKLRIFHDKEDRNLTVHKTLPIGDILKQAMTQFGLDGHILRECVRLRNVSDASTPAEPLDDLTKPASSISGISMGSKELYLEVRKPDAEFPVYRPTDMCLRLVPFTNDKWMPEFFCIDRNANLGAFQDAVAQKLGIPKEKQLITRDAGRSYGYTSYEPMIIKGDGSRLLWDLGFVEGLRIYVEAAEDINVAAPKALGEIERLKNSYQLHHNIPPSSTINSSILVDKRITLADLKAKLSEKVKIPVEELRVSRTNGWTMTELKNLQDSLELCYITDGTMLLLEQGRPLQPGEIKLKFQWYEPESEGKEEKLDDLFDCVIDENAPIAQLKVMLAKKLKDDKNIDIEPSRLRIREATWRSVGKVFPNNSTFKQCASFLYSGKAFAFQRLQGEENVTSAKSLILIVRRWHPSTWQLGPPEEIVTHEDMPLSEFRAQMATKFGIKNIGVAKNSWSSVDPLEIADLDWTREKDGDERSFDYFAYPPQATLASRPFYLHDTEVVIVKDADEPLKELSAEEKKALKRRANVASNKYSGREKALHISTGTS